MQVSDTTRVLVVLVAHDGARWLPATLDALEAQDHPNVDIVAVDNDSTDGSRELLVQRLGTDRVLVADRDLGFPAAVSMALDARGDDIPLVWLLHDDVAFLPDALTQLISVLDADPRLGAVGPKLRFWSHGERLQSVGWTIDMTGRADSGVDHDELDQGQRDQQRRTLYVSTAGMLVRRSALEEVGRLDPRFHVFRDDLDLCWRLWIAGHDVEVVPSALGVHVSAAGEYVRLGQTSQLGPRYFAERNTLATLIRNHGPARLPFVLMLYFVVGIAKVAGFVLTRRLGDAFQTVRAWLWNAVRLRETLHLRRATQATRRRTDTELRELFGRVSTRLRAYSEAIAYWIAGGDGSDERPIDEDEPTDEDIGLAAFVRRRPVAIAGLLLIAVVVMGAWSLLVPGSIRGGQLAPWPATATAFLADHVAGWHTAGAFGTAQTPSPAQALLGLLQFVLGGSAYLAPRVLLFGSIGAAWVFALRAAQLFSARRVPRVVAATAYVLSPPAIAALMTGQVTALVVLVAIPAVVATGLVLVDPKSSPARGWRAVSAMVLIGAATSAFEPVMLPVFGLAALVTVILTFGSPGDGAWKRALTIRVVAALAGTVALLLPWSLTLFDPSGPLTAAGGTFAEGQLWQWLALSPSLAGFPGLLAGAGFVLAGLLGLVIGVTRVPGLVAGLWMVALVGAILGWMLGRSGLLVWPGLPLMLTAAAFAGLYAVAFASAESQLSRYGFGWRQISAAVTATAVAVGLGVVVTSLVRSPLDAYALDEPPLPAFVLAEAEQGERFRVLVLADSVDGVAWEVVDGGGPTMASLGLPPSPALDVVEDVVEDVVGRSDLTAAARLGALSIRYVVVPANGASDDLDEVLTAQIQLEPRPVVDGRVYRVAGALPPAAIVGLAPDDSPWDVDALVGFHPLEPDEVGDLRGTATLDGNVRLAEVDEGLWGALADARPVPRVEDGAPLVAFGPVSEGQRVVVGHDADAQRILEVGGQLLALLLVVSLALRPPRFARRRSQVVPGARPQLPGRESGR
ncbi:MAG: glycosyltransferase family 2 protein [Nitriliruptoraceae bacterium]